jgi:tetratricopeptide (TPR) repeat protein
VLRVERLYGYARTLLNRGALDQAEALAREAVATGQQLAPEDAHDGLSSAWATLGMIAEARGDLEQAAAAFTKRVACAGADARSESRYRALYYLAEIARYQGDLARAQALLEQAHAGAEAAGNDWDSAIMTTMLAHLARQRHDTAQARSHYLDSLARFQRFGSPTFFAWTLEGYGALLCAEGGFLRVARLSAAAAMLREQAQTPLPAAERAAFDDIVAQSRSSLGDTAFATAWGAGSLLTMAEALTEAARDA